MMSYILISSVAFLVGAEMSSRVPRVEVFMKKIRRLFYRKAIVKIGSNYAIERRIFFYVAYLDLDNQEFWWARGSKFFKCCLGDESRVRKVASGEKDPKVVEVL